MTYDDYAEMYTLSSGRQIYANLGIFGLTPNGTLTDGYDSKFYFGESKKNPAFTYAERCEIAEMMITRWRWWADDEVTPQEGL